MVRQGTCPVANERQLSSSHTSEPTPPNPISNSTPVVVKTEKRQVTCFTCHQKGHKSPQCPQKVNQVRRIQIPSNKIVPLKENELFGSVGGHCMPITCNSGADITVVPEEYVRQDQFTGGTCEVDSFNKVRSSGKRCSIIVNIAGREFQRQAVTQPGDDLSWTVCLSLSFSKTDEMAFISQQMRDKLALQEEDICYLPPKMENGILKSGIMVRDGTLADADADTDMGNTESVSQCEERVVEHSLDSVVPEAEESELRESDEVVLVNDVEQPSVLVEAGGDQVGVSAEGEGEQGVLLEGITSDVPRPKLAQATEVDPTLATARSLAVSKSEGYHYQEGILFRTRLDKFGDAREQICLPQPYREKCLKMARDNFRHLGRNKMVELIRPFFYWPTITVDCLNHTKKCECCQKRYKSVPRKSFMQEREMVSVPAERVAIDLVGPFPTARGGFKYLLTCIDLATRWPGPSL